MNDPCSPVRNIGETLIHVDLQLQQLPKKQNCTVFGIHSKFPLFLPKNKKTKTPKNCDFFDDFSQFPAHLVDSSVQRGHTFRILLVHLCTDLVRCFTKGWLLSGYEKNGGVLDTRKRQMNGPLYHDFSYGMSASYLCVVYGYHMQSNFYENIYKIHFYFTSISANPSDLKFEARRSWRKLLDLAGQFSQTPPHFCGLQQFPGQPAGTPER